MKKVLSIIVLVVLLAYIAVAAVAFCPKPSGQTCDGLELVSSGNQRSQFETQEDVLDLMHRFGIDPMGKPMDDIACSAIEDSLRTLPLVLHCECWKTVGTRLAVNITCRTPIMRIIRDDGKSRYIDRDGVVFDRLPKPVSLPVATGNIDDAFAQKELFALACFLQEDDFWNAQIEQIIVDGSHNVELIPRVGDHIIRLGSVEHIKEKFAKLRTFYDKGLSQVGWDRYDVLDISYGNQVIGIKHK